MIGHLALSVSAEQGDGQRHGAASRHRGERAVAARRSRAMTASIPPTATCRRAISSVSLSAALRAGSVPIERGPEQALATAGDPEQLFVPSSPPQRGARAKRMARGAVRKRTFESGAMTAGDNRPRIVAGALPAGR